MGGGGGGGGGETGVPIGLLLTVMGYPKYFGLTVCCIDLILQYATKNINISCKK